MAKDWRCLIGRHDWREVDTEDHDKFAECARCGKHDWMRTAFERVEKPRGVYPPPGAGGDM